MPSLKKLISYISERVSVKKNIKSNSKIIVKHTIILRFFDVT